MRVCGCEAPCVQETSGRGGRQGALQPGWGRPRQRQKPGGALREPCLTSPPPGRCLMEGCHSAPAKTALPVRVHPALTSEPPVPAGPQREEVRGGSDLALGSKPDGMSGLGRPRLTSGGLRCLPPPLCAGAGHLLWVGCGANGWMQF